MTMVLNMKNQIEEFLVISRGFWLLAFLSIYNHKPSKNGRKQAKATCLDTQNLKIGQETKKLARSYEGSGRSHRNRTLV